MANSVQIKEPSNLHNAIADYLILNPSMKKSEVARHFKVSPPWLSVIIHSDAFKALLAEKQEQFFALASASVADKLNMLAHSALDKLLDTVELETDHKELRETAQMALDRTGFAPIPSGAVSGGNTYIQQNNFQASPEMLAEARQRIMQRTGITLESPQLPAPTEAVQSGGDR